MPLGIDPKVDFAFKMVFGNPEHTSITIHFLNAVLNFPQPITAVVILNPIQRRERYDDKLAVLDVLAADAAGRRYNIEMQTSMPSGLVQRLTYSNCLSYVNQLKSGRRYTTLLPAISICVLDDTLFRHAAEYHLSFQLRCDQHPEIPFNPDLAFHLLELPKYQPPVNNRNALGPLEKWLCFLKLAHNLEADELAHQLSDDPFREAAGVLEMISESPEDRDFYEARLRFAEMERHALREEGWMKGREEGLKEGREEGRKEGREEGAEKGLRLAFAKMIQNLQKVLGEDVSDVSDLLRCSSEELEKAAFDLQRRLSSRDN